MKIRKVKQFDVYYEDEKYYICLGINEKSLYKSFEFIEGELTQAHDFVNQVYKNDFAFSGFAVCGYELYCGETFEDYIYYAMTQTFTYYETETLDFSKPVSLKKLQVFELDYRAKKINVKKEIVKNWYLKNRLLGLANFYTIKDLMKLPCNQGIVAEYAWTKEDMCKAQKYYMKVLFNDMLANTSVRLYKDDNYLYYAYVQGNKSGRIYYHYKISVKEEPLVKVRHFFQVYNFGIASKNTRLLVDGLKPVLSFDDLSN